MKKIYFNNVAYDDFTLSTLNLDELSKLSSEVHSAIQHLAVVKKTLNLNKAKTDKKKLMKVEYQLSIYIQLSNSISYHRRKLRDTMQKERDWYKKYFQSALEIGGKKAKELVDTINDKMGYKIE